MARKPKKKTESEVKLKVDIAAMAALIVDPAVARQFLIDQGEAADAVAAVGDADVVTAAQARLAEVEKAQVEAESAAANETAEGAEASEEASEEDGGAPDDSAESTEPSPSVEEIERHAQQHGDSSVHIDANGKVTLTTPEPHLTENMPVKVERRGKDVHAAERLKVWIGDTQNMLRHLETEAGSEIDDIAKSIHHATTELARRL